MWLFNGSSPLVTLALGQRHKSLRMLRFCLHATLRPLVGPEFVRDLYGHRKFNVEYTRAAWRQITTNPARRSLRLSGGFCNEHGL
jgi:hypothetical protein